MAVEKMYSLTEAMQMLQVTRRTFYRWIVDGKFKAVKIGRKYAVKESELQRFFDDGTEPAPQPVEPPQEKKARKAPTAQAPQPARVEGQGDGTAQYSFGLTAYNKKDYTGATRWFQIAAAQGHPDARKCLEDMEKQGAH